MNEIEYEKLIVHNVSIIAQIIDKMDELAPADLFTLRKLNPRLFEILKEINIDDLYEILEKNRDDLIHGPEIEKLLKAQNKELLMGLLSSVNECGE